MEPTGLTNGDGRPDRKEGLYRQKETGAEMYLENKTPEYGSPMIDAFVKGGWVLVEGPVAPKAEVVPEVVAEPKVEPKVVVEPKEERPLYVKETKK